MKFLGLLRNSERVVDRPNSHLDSHPEVKDLLLEALRRIEPKGKHFIVEEIDFDRPIGETICVTTQPSDKITFEYRPGKSGPSRFVLNREPESCSTITVILKKAYPWNNYEYVVITAYIGKIAEPEPWDPQATEKAVAFWANHALVARR